MREAKKIFKRVVNDHDEAMKRLKPNMNEYYYELSEQAISHFNRMLDCYEDLAQRKGAVKGFMVGIIAGYFLRLLIINL